MVDNYPLIKPLLKFETESVMVKVGFYTKRKEKEIIKHMFNKGVSYRAIGAKIHRCESYVYMIVSDLYKSREPVKCMPHRHVLFSPHYSELTYEDISVAEKEFYETLITKL